MKFQFLIGNVLAKRMHFGTKLQPHVFQFLIGDVLAKKETPSHMDGYQSFNSL